MERPVKIVVGGFELLATGTTLSYGYQPVEIYPVDATYHVSLVYETAADKPPAISLDQTIPHKSTVRALNFNFNVGLASGAPLHVANWNGRKMYFVFSCHLVGDVAIGVRSTAFSFYLGEAV